MCWKNLSTVVFFVSVCLAISAVIPANAIQQDETISETESPFLSSIRRLTFEGRRAGEGYFSTDGKKMVFQSERVEGNPFFQMYVLDLELGDITRVSPGHGKTTCGWFHPSGTKVMFASTQHDPKAKQKQKDELEKREKGEEERYSWDYDETYELYSYDLETEKYTRLTNDLGYDAEGSYSPDGKLIAFASNRNGYADNVTDEQKKILKTDKTYMMDIYVMNADGSDVRQLTDVAGYDGGPFFSPDGKHICWRRFDEKGVTAEIMTMNVDGSDQKKLTNLRAMSWAPFYHPSGKYLVFSSNNKHGFNFELYVAAVDGKASPVRVTNNEGFDGLPSFSPDGKQIFWTSTRHDVSARKGQIFRANWDHQYALKALGLDGTRVNETDAAQSGTNSATATTAGFDGQDIMRHVDFLCRQELGGRLTGTSGEHQATAYVAAYLDHMGVQPDGDNGTWYQEFEFPAGAKLGTENRLLVTDGRNEADDEQIYELNKDWVPLTFSKNGLLETGPIVFVGYGISAPEEDQQPEYDSYDQTDVSGKWVLMFRYSPDDVPDSRRQHLHYHSSLRKKAMVARDKGARGIIIVSGPNSNVRKQLVPLENDFSDSGSSIGAISITDDVAESWLARSEKNLNELQDQLDAGLNVEAFEIPELKLAGLVDVSQQVGRGRNVIGRMQMGATPSDQAILIGAHIDHLGTGTGGSLARDDEKGKIHVGADDNASGVAAMLEVAEFLANLQRDGKLALKRDIIFAAWSGEELGLHGSHHFVKQRIDGSFQGDPHDLNQLFAYYDQMLGDFDTENFTASNLKLLKSNAREMQVVVNLLSSAAANSGSADNEKQRQRSTDLLRQANELIQQAESKQVLENGNSTFTSSKALPVVACLNMDMVGRMKKQLVLQGLGSSNDWNRIIEKANVPVGLSIDPSNDTQLPTDSSSFYRAGIPILSAFTGSHTDYHTPRDTPEKLNYPDAARIAHLMGLITRELAIGETTPGYVKQADAPKKKQARSGRRARLGSIPNYTEKVNGVLLDDVSQNSPAAKAGIKGGDIIVELSGKKIENIYDYQYAIDSLKVGKVTKIVVMRGNQRITLDITPASRD